VNDNPYQPPERFDHSQPAGVALNNRGRGPALYIVTGGLIAAILASPFHSNLNPIGLAITPFGTLAGGLLYRARSKDWPVDPRARMRQLMYAAVVIVVIPAGIAPFNGLLGPGLGAMIIGLVVGAYIAVGILASGVRRPENGS
jgi:hypothetical protein